MAPPRKHQYDPDTLLALAAESPSIAEIARKLDMRANTLVQHLRNNDPDLYDRVKAALKPPDPAPPRTMDTPGVRRKADGSVEAVCEPILGPLSQVTDAEAYVRERWGFSEDEWIISTCTGNTWEGPAAGGGVVVYSQVKGTFRKKLDLLVLSPATHVPALVKQRKVRRAQKREETWVVEIDHQAPYHDEDLDAATTAMVADLQPDGHVFAGDLLDLPTISKHADHPSAQATPQDCVNAGYGILRRRAEAAPNARRLLIRGNHDWRIDGETLLRSERMHGLAPAEEVEAALSLKRLLHCDTLGVEFVADPRGWQHDEVEIVPGPYGLVARHGWLTGEKTAEKSVRKRGRSIIVGHTHTPEHAWIWDPSMEIHRQGVVGGAQCLARDKRFPHFAVLDGWKQGPVVVTVRSARDFVIEQTHWFEGKLYWRDRSWKPA